MTSTIFSGRWEENGSDARSSLVISLNWFNKVKELIFMTANYPEMSASARLLQIKFFLE